MFFRPFRPTQPDPASYTITLDPARNALMSLAMLTADVQDDNVDEWARQAAAALTPDQRERNRLVFDGPGAALMLDEEYPDFPAYLDALESRDQLALRDRALRQIAQSLACAGVWIGDPRALLSDEQGFVAQIMRLSPVAAADADLLCATYALLSDPPAMQRLVVAHLRELYEQALGAKWERQMSNLSGLIFYLQQRPLPRGNAANTIRAFIGRELPDAISAQLDGVRRVVFVLAPHIRLHAARFGSPDTVWVFVLAHFPSLPVRAAPIKRAELIRPLAALADDTRLHILELLARDGELPTQAIIAQIDQSQPNVSRHLKQLAGAGFVDERRGEGANKRYRLNPQQIDATFWTLKQLLAPENFREAAPDARDEQPPALRRFLDPQGRVTSWPAKRQDQDMVLAYLASKFARGREYNEREVNDLLSQWHTFRDPATLRRDLYDARLFDRTRDGARYWRADDTTADG